MTLRVIGGPNGTTADLVALWRTNTECNNESYNSHTAGIIRAIELELMYRPVTERIAAGYPK